MFWCDPPGSSAAENLMNQGHRVEHPNYILFHDQEPIHLDIHRELFDSVIERNSDSAYWYPQHKAIITSERDSEFIDQVCSLYGWKPYYYFFHGWAALDWYRGYNRSYLGVDPKDREIKYSFLSPNRIIGGMRNHRVTLMYLLLERECRNALISFPEFCPVENQSIYDIITDMDQTHWSGLFQQAALPWNFPGEQDHPMHSCWLSLWPEVCQSLAYVVTETVYHGRRHHLTEKTFKPICQQIPFVLVSTTGSLEYLRSYGFKTFGDFWDESYDQISDDRLRLLAIADVLKYLDNLGQKERQELYQQTVPILRHNFRHFYQGRFESVLSSELDVMLDTLQRDFTQ